MGLLVIRRGFTFKPRRQVQQTGERGSELGSCGDKLLDGEETLLDVAIVIERFFSGALFPSDTSPSKRKT